MTKLKGRKPAEELVALARKHRKALRAGEHLPAEVLREVRLICSYMAKTGKPTRGESVAMERLLRAIFNEPTMPPSLARR